MSIQTVPSCDNCFWLKVDFSRGLFCEHPRFKREIPLDQAAMKTFCNNVGWMEKK